MASIEGGNLSLLTILLRGNGRPPSEFTLRLALETALELGNPARLEATKILAGHGLSASTRSSCLRHTTEKHDFDLLPFLLAPGDIIWELDEDSLTWAVLHDLLDAVKLFVDHGVPHAVRCVALLAMVNNNAFMQNSSDQIAQALLDNSRARQRVASLLRPS